MLGLDVNDTVYIINILFLHITCIIHYTLVINFMNKNIYIYEIFMGISCGFINGVSILLSLSTYPVLRIYFEGYINNFKAL